VHLCLWTDWSREVVHNDGKTRSGAARHHTTGVCMKIAWMKPSKIWTRSGTTLIVVYRWVKLYSQNLPVGLGFLNNYSIDLLKVLHLKKKICANFLLLLHITEWTALEKCLGMRHQIFFDLFTYCTICTRKYCKYWQNPVTEHLTVYSHSYLLLHSISPH